MNEFCLNNENAAELALAEHDQAMDQLQEDLKPNLFDNLGNKVDLEQLSDHNKLAKHAEKYKAFYQKHKEEYDNDRWSITQL